MKEPDPEELLRGILAKEPRFRIEAYKFLFEALEFTVNRVGLRRHVTGQELLEGVRDYSLQQFGGMARMVFDRWGIRSTEDFGRIVFLLVDAGLMGKTAKDSIEDFKAGYDFDSAFPIDYHPDRP